MNYSSVCVILAPSFASASADQFLKFSTAVVYTVMSCAYYYLPVVVLKPGNPAHFGDI